MTLKQVIVIRTDLKMGRGKIAAQSAHASVAALEKVTKIVVKVSGKKELLDLFMEAKRKFPAALIKDAGLTQIKSGEATCLAIGPAEEIDLNLLTKHLKLL